MKTKNSKNVFSGLGAWLKERVRKLLVALKKNPQSIPITSLAAAFIHYTFNLSKISDTTAKLQGQNMGLAGFVTMLFMILSFVCMINAFPKRQKPKVPMILLMIVLYGAVIFADIHYIGRIAAALTGENAIQITQNTIYIAEANNAVVINIVLIALTIICILLEPKFESLFKKIKTSIEVEGSGDIATIDIADED